MFSELVDSVALKSGRPDQALNRNIADCVNSTIRECQTLALFYKDLVEDTIAITGNPVIWTYPTTMWKMRTVKYPDGSFPKLIQPGPNQIDHERYYYAASDYYVFVGPDITERYVDGVIKCAYYNYLPRLVYFNVTQRPAVFDYATETWSYLDPTITNDSSPAAIAARKRVTNWLVTGYQDLITEGALAKLFKTTGDQNRAVTSYSLYKQMQKYLTNSEAFEALQNG